MSAVEELGPLERRESQTTAELATLRQEVASGYEAAIELARRLGPLLNEHADEPGKPTSIDEHLVPLADEVRSIRYTATSTRRLLVDLLDRLEL